MEEINELLEQLHTLLIDYDELLEMNKSTDTVDKEITSRIHDLKIKVREQIEKSLDIPVILDGELLTYERAIKKKKYLDKVSDYDLLDKISIKNDGERAYYYYLEKDVYHLDIDDEDLMTSIRFVNSKKNFDYNQLPDILNSIARMCIITYGYRLSYTTTLTKKLNIENIYNGTVFNNSNYSVKVYNLLDKLFQSIARDYIKRVKSSYDLSDYIIHKIENHWLIINRLNGATDVLNDDESEICEFANNVTKCFDDDNILVNSENTDKEIEKLHKAIARYIEEKNNQ